MIAYTDVRSPEILERRSPQVLKLPCMYMEEASAADSLSALAAAVEHTQTLFGHFNVDRIAAGNCAYYEIESDASPRIVYISGCLFGMAVGPEDSMGYAHIPSGMFGDTISQEDTVTSLVKKALAVPESVICLAGLGERRLLQGQDAYDAERAAAIVTKMSQSDMGHRWKVFEFLVGEMKHYGIPLSRLALSVKGTGEDALEHVRNAVVVLPRDRKCVVFYK